MNEERRRVGELRPSQLLFTYGIGSIVDLPEISVIVMGLEDWRPNADTTREIIEERLLAAVRTRLGHQLNRFLSPPIGDTSGDPMDRFGDVDLTGVPVATFPRWMVCPVCRYLGSIDSGLFTLKQDRYRRNRAWYVHRNCNHANQPNAVPARFVVACEEGHLDDFPWVEFVHAGQTPCANAPLRLIERGPSGEARDLFVKCEGCERTRPLTDAFGRQNREKMPICSGRRPHLRDYDPDGCERHMRPLVLGASNAWFPLVYSSLAIPGATVKIDQLVDEQWARLQLCSVRAVLTAFRADGQLPTFRDYTDDQIWDAIERKRQPSTAESEDDPLDLKLPEWRVFTQFNPDLNSGEFRLLPIQPPARFVDQIEQVILVERVREVRALTGFTRLDSPGEMSEPDADDEIRTIVSLSRRASDWLPATETRGEGIFLRFKEEQMAAWLQQTAVLARSRQFFSAHTRWHKARFLDDPSAHYPGMRYVLIHSFAHALMRQMAMEAGYSAASIRERIYARNPDEPGGPMAGVLIYTAAPDSEGTLGGLVKLGHTDTLERHIQAALENAALCASDPTCAEHPPSDDGISLHAAACHACLFVPETSCEHGNRYLDRTTLVPTFTDSDLAYFNLD